MRNLIDGGSLADIIFTFALSQLNIPDETLCPMTNPLGGFTGNEVTPLSQITLKVTFGVAPCSVTIIVDFLVVDSPSIYNTIIEWVTKHAIWVGASTYRMILKFPTPNRIGVLDGALTLS